MATVVSKTSVKIDELLTDVVVNAQVVDGYLIVTTRGGSQFNAGTVGGDGTAWYSGNGAPAGSSYAIGDFYLDQTNGDYYSKTGATTWILRGNLRGLQGNPGVDGDDGVDGAKWFTGSGAPANDLGVVGDFYLNSTNGDFYTKTGTTTWELEGSLKGATGDVGPAGPEGVVYVDPEPPLTDEPEGHMWYDEDEESVEPFSWNELVDRPTLHYLHNQAVAAATWNVAHNLGFFPNVTVVDSAGNVVMGDVRHVDAFSVTITFGAAFGGQAYLS